MVEEVTHDTLGQHWLVDGQCDVEGEEEIVGDLHVNLLLLYFQFMGLCPLLGVALY